MVCPDCTAQPPAFVRTIAAFDYAPPVDSLIGALKTGLQLSRAGLLGRLLANALVEALAQAPELPRPAALVAIPASRASLPNALCLPVSRVR